MTKKVIGILGSTGSIGVSTLEVARQFSDLFEVAALAAGRNIARLEEQIREFRPGLVSVMDEELAERLEKSLASYEFKPEIVCGPEGYNRVATHPDIEMLVSAMVGAAGLLPTL